MRVGPDWRGRVFLLPNGFYGEFSSPTNCEYVLASAMMPMFGMKTPRNGISAFPYKESSVPGSSWRRY